MPLNLPGNTNQETAGAYTARMFNALRDEALKQHYQQLQNQYYGPNIESEINQRNALTEGYNIENQYKPQRLDLQNQTAQENLNQLKKTNPLAYEKLVLANKHQEQINQFYPDLTRAQIQNYQMGGRGGMGVGAKDDMLFQSSVGKDNPGFNANEIYQASNIISQGGDKMPDGRPIMVSPATRRALDRALKSTTTAGILTGGVRSNQAEAELQVLNDYAQKGLEPYGTTYDNMSAEQILDSFKTDEKSQKRLGRLIAAQALGYEAAQNRIRLANGQPGVTATEDLMKISGQQINTKFPRLSYTARKEAARYLDEALKKGLDARKSVGIGASSIVNNKSPSPVGNKRFKYNPQSGLLEEVK